MNQRNYNLYYKLILTVALPDLAHTVLLNVDYILPKPVQAKLEKAVALAELLDALDVHAAPLVAAPEKVFDDIALVFAMLVAVHQQVSGDVETVFAMLVAAPQQLFGNIVAVVAMLVSAPQ